MSENKFRAMDSYGTWHYFTLEEILRAIYLNDLSALDVAWDTENNEEYKHIGRIIGPKDKNGKEICDGDIITDTIKDSIRTWHVFYDPEKAAYMISNIDDPDWYQLLGNPTSTFGEIEIIGNIYENKELLRYPICEARSERKMTRLTEKERTTFYKILDQDLEAINCTVVEQIKEIWNRTRDQILYERGLDVKIARKEKIEIEIEELRQELHSIESELNSEPLTVQQRIELGGKANEYSRYSDGEFFGIPVTSQLEYDIVQRIKLTIDTDAPAKYLHDLRALSSFL